MIYVLYSDDYELYLGGNYTSEKRVLLQPTEQLLAACESAAIPMTLFCDVLCLQCYREHGFPDFPAAVDQQLRGAVGRGHDVQAHVHPHWLDTTIEYNADRSTRYAFDQAYFLLGNRREADETPFRTLCTDIFRRVREYLEDVITPVDPKYQCRAFRAGGFGLQPHDRAIIAALLDAGYLIDSSIVPGLLLATNVNRIDFREVPRFGNYYLNPARGIHHASTSGLFEIPIAALPAGKGRWLLAKNLAMRIANRLTRRHQVPSRGYTVQSTERQVPNQNPLARIAAHLRTIRRGHMMLELSANPETMFALAKRYIRRYYSQSEDDLFFAVICHSKSIDDRLLRSLTRFHQRLQAQYSDDIAAITFRQVVERLASKTGPVV